MRGRLASVKRQTVRANPFYTVVVFFLRRRPKKTTVDLYGSMARERISRVLGYLRRRSSSNRSLFPSFFAEAPGELGWVLTLVIVSLVSAGIGAVVMVTLLHCRRSVRQRLHTPPLSPSPPLSQQNFEPYSILIQRSNIANCSQFLPIIAVLNAQLYHRMLLQYRYGEKEKERERGGDSSG